MSITQSVGIKQNQPMRSACRIALALVAMAVFLTSAGAAQAAFQPKGILGGPSAGTQGGEFNAPIDVAIGPAGDIYVADLYNHRIQKFDSEGSFLRAWGKNVNNSGPGICTIATDCQAGAYSSSAGGFRNPSSIAVDRAGHVYVTDQHNRRIQKFNSDGVFIGTIGWGVNGGSGFEICSRHTTPCYAGILGSQQGQFSNPYGIDVSRSGRIYVADHNNIQMFAPDGDYLGEWGSSGTGDGDFDNPIGVAVDRDSNVWVVDQMNDRIQKFTSSGNWLGELPVNAAYGIVTRGDRVYVSSYGSHKVNALRLNGDKIGAFGWGVNGGSGFEICLGDFNWPSCSMGIQGQGIGQFDYPYGIDTDGAGNVYVADTNNHRIQKFGY